VVQSSKKVEIIRFTRNNGAFSAHRLAANELVAALEKPTLRAESVLDGIFSESVVVVEADGDRLVYHTTWETLSKELMLDVHFAAVGGTGGIADICKLYRTLDIPVAVIADLDIIVDIDKCNRILHILTNSNEANAIMEDVKVLANEIRKCPPTINSHEFKQRFDEIGILETNWDNGDDIKIRRELRGLTQDLDRMRRLKNGGISKLPGNIADSLSRLVESLRAVGFFLVPVGELEGWLASEGITESKENKAAWSNAAALKIQSRGPSDGDIWNFVREVGRYLHDAKSIASTQ